MMHVMHMSKSQCTFESLEYDNDNPSEEHLKSLFFRAPISLIIFEMPQENGLMEIYEYESRVPGRAASINPAAAASSILKTE